MEDLASRHQDDEARLIAAFQQRMAHHLTPPSAEEAGEEDGGDGGAAWRDWSLRKWLVARDWNLEAASRMFEASSQFRAQWRPECLLAEYQPPEVLQRYLPGGFVGFDREGGPVRVELFGALDLPGLLRSCSWPDLQRAKLVECETALRLCRQQSRRLGRPVIGMTVVFDMSGASARFLWPPGVAAYMRLVRMLEDNYPELVRRLLVVNSPSVFPLLYRVCRPLMSRAMRGKIAVLSGDPAAVAQGLAERIPPDQLPAYLGGLRRDANGDPRCSAEVCQGGRVPAKYFLDAGDAAGVGNADA